MEQMYYKILFGFRGAKVGQSKVQLYYNILNYSISVLQNRAKVSRSWRGTGQGTVVP
jgi:hypothetical protein